jgi:hypothetical protein
MKEITLFAAAFGAKLALLDFFLGYGLGFLPRIRFL